MRRTVPFVVVVAAALAGLPGSAPRAEDAPAAPAADAPTVTPEQRDAALAKAFRYLDEQVWGLDEGGSPRKQYTVAIMGLASLLAGDRTGADAARLPPRKKEAERARDYLVRYAAEVAALYAKDDRKREKDKRRDREPAAAPGFPMGPSQYVWPLGVSGLFLAESAKRGQARKECTGALDDIVRVIEGAQQANGGWGHDDAQRPGLGLPPVKIPLPGRDAIDYPGTLLAASNCALTGLGLAHALRGDAARAKSLENARDYYRSSQNGDGAWPYDPSQRDGDTPSGGEGNDAIARALAASRGDALSVARTTGAIFALLAGGEDPKSAEVARALAIVDAHPEWAGEGHGSATMALQWAALLARARGPEAWSTFRRTWFPRVLAAQKDDGSFDCACAHASGATTCDTEPIGDLPGMDDWVRQARVYVTAIHALVLVLDRADLQAVPKMPDVPAETTPR